MIRKLEFCVMSRHRKKWSTTQKEEVLLYSEQHGVAQASREYNVSSATIYNWRNKVSQLGSAGLQTGSKTAHELELAQLKRENNELKKIVAEKELALRIKDSLLKKSSSQSRKR